MLPNYLFSFNSLQGDTNIVTFNLSQKLIKPKIILIKLSYTKSHDAHICKFSSLKITQIDILLCKIYILVV